MEPEVHAELDDKERWSWWHSARRRILDAVARPAVDDLEVERGRSLDVLDVGCGTGRSGDAAVGGRRRMGCDVALEALHFARRRGDEMLVRASAESLPFAAETFDVALALDVLEHHDDDAAVSAELLRVLRPGGLLVATVPAFQALFGPHDVLVHHRRRYRLPELVELLSGAGFDVTRKTYFNTLLFPAVLAVQSARRLVRRGARPAAASDNPDRLAPAANAVLRELFAVEALWLPRANLPVGVSALALARRKERA